MSKFNKNVVFLLYAFCLHSVFASPIERTVNVAITCPLINDHRSPIKNYGLYLYGAGIERRGRNAQKMRWFRGVAQLDARIPLKLNENGYYNDGVFYNHTNGAIICRYDTIKGFDSFAMTYVMPDGTNGMVYYEDSGKIKLKLPHKPKS